MSELVIAESAITVERLIGEMASALRVRTDLDPRQEARDIVAALFDAPRSWAFTHSEAVVAPGMAASARRAVQRRLQGAPLAYAVGRASFRHLTLAVDERVLIPRPETELLVDLIMKELGDHTGGVAVDVGTGSGAIALALASEGRFDEVYATDVSLDALDVAGKNKEVVGPSLRARVHLAHGSLLRPLPDFRARVIVSNPPYIAFDEAAALPMSVRDWEPAAALFSGGGGLAVTAALVREATPRLEDGGLLALEVDARRASLVAEMAARESELENVKVRQDLTGRERFVLARKRRRG